MKAPQLALAAVACALTATLTACGSKSSTPAVSVSMPAAPAAGTILTTAQVKAVVAAAGANMTSVHETLKISTSAADITGDADISRVGATTATQMTLTMPAMGKVQVRLVDNGYYLKLDVPQLGGKWLKIDLADTSNPIAKTMASLTSVSPDQMFAQYAGGLIGGTFIGSDAVGDHYLVNVNSAAAIKGLPAAMASNPMIVQSMKQLPKTIKMNLWIKDSRLAQMTMDLGSSGSLTITLSNYGVPVSVVAPPTADVTTLPSLG